MAYRWKNDLTHDDVTPKSVYLNRRQLIGGAVGLGAIAAAGGAAANDQVNLVPNSLEEITSYNNFYEFGTGKGDPAANAHRLTTAPWSIQIDGMRPPRRL